MDDDPDPDDLAAAFFAQQAAKENAKAALPIDEWRRVVEATMRTNPSASGKGGSAMDPSSWLVTTMPPAPEHRDGREGGIVGMVLDQSNISCGHNAGDDASATGETGLTAAEAEARRRIKGCLVQKLEEKMSR